LSLQSRCFFGLIRVRIELVPFEKLAGAKDSVR